MDWILLGVLSLIFIGGKLDVEKGYLDTYLSRQQSRMINGVFVMLVFIRHFKEYIECGAYDKVFWTVDGYFEQLIVTPFLFYSGYGILVSIKNKKGYFQTFPKRIFKVWFQFAIAVCLFLILNLFIGKSYNALKILLSFTAWESIGNSNWYILAILVLYILSYFGGLLTKKSGLKTIIFVTVGCCFYVIVLILCKKGSWYYNTIFCYPFGMFYGEYEWKLKEFLEKMFTYLLLMMACIVAFVVSYIFAIRYQGLIGLVAIELRGIFFILFVVLATSNIKIGNPVLNWLGKHTFEIYMLQRLPMIALNGIFMNSYLYFLICVVMTGLLATLYHRIVDKLIEKWGECNKKEQCLEDFVL